MPHPPGPSRQQRARRLAGSPSHPAGILVHRQLVARVEALSAQYGSEPLEEAALAHPGKRAAEVLDNCIQAAESSNVLIRSPFPAETIADPIYIDRDSFQPPCLLGVDAANQMRDRLGVPPGPISNPRLSEIVGTNVDHLQTLRANYQISSANIAHAIVIVLPFKSARCRTRAACSRNCRDCEPPL